MNEIEKVISELDFQYFGTGQHKMEAETFLGTENTVFLDVRAKEETDTLKLSLSHYCEVLEIPTNEIPKRRNEIPTDKTVGIFCSAGVRASIVFAYLKSKGYQNIKIIPGGYPPLLAAIMPGKIYKKLSTK
ncbi:rhodanese-like domain-containing protein [Marinifilum sp. RC60d5]|uniref:rhodanese-like domain-containing protein n=1 Tax=Marinifilum sp. RC60d5 TaxID=3458414 RepID=UPI00403612D6